MMTSVLVVSPFKRERRIKNQEGDAKSGQMPMLYVVRVL